MDDLIKKEYNRNEITWNIYNGFKTEESSDYGASLNLVGALGWWDYEDFDGDQYANLKRGYGVLLDYLLKNIPYQIILKGEAVLNIDYSGSKVNVKTTRKTYTANQVLVTVSLGVLKQKSIAFTPNLPAKKIEAINKLGFGLMDKIILEFPSDVCKSSDEGYKIIWTEQMGSIFKQRYPSIDVRIL